MRRIIQLAILVALLGAGLLVWWQMFPGPETEIQRRMAKLQELFSFRESDGNLSAIADLHQLGALFEKDAEIHVDMRGGPYGTLAGRDNIVQTAGGVRQAAGNLNLEFLDVVVTLGSDEQTAVVEATGRATQPGSSELWIQELRFEFVKTPEGWLITLVETVRTLTRHESRPLLLARLPRAV